MIMKILTIKYSKLQNINLKQISFKNLFRNLYFNQDYKTLITSIIKEANQKNIKMHYDNIDDNSNKNELNI